MFLLVITILCRLPAASGGYATGITTPSVNQITLGSSERQVKARLGAAATLIQEGRDDELGMGELRKYDVPGLTVHLNRPRGEREFRVNQIEVSRERWVLSDGLRVGMSRDDVLKLMGTAAGVERTEKGDLLVYQLSDRDGRLLLLIKDERVVAIRILAENS